MDASLYEPINVYKPLAAKIGIVDGPFEYLTVGAWRDEIDQLLFPGGYFKEFIFFHMASRTLILTDTIINLELDKISEPWRTATKLTGMYHPQGQTFFGMRLPLLFQRRRAKAAIGKIYSWQPQRIVLSHGRCFDEDADQVIRRIFGAPPRWA